MVSIDFLPSVLLPVLIPVVAANALKCLDHDDGVASNDLNMTVSACSLCNMDLSDQNSGCTYTHAQSDFAAICFLFQSLVENYVEEHLGDA